MDRHRPPFLPLAEPSRGQPPWLLRTANDDPAAIVLDDDTDVAIGQAVDRVVSSHHDRRAHSWPARALAGRDGVFDRSADQIAPLKESVGAAAHSSQDLDSSCRRECTNTVASQGSNDNISGGPGHLVVQG